MKNFARAFQFWFDKGAHHAARYTNKTMILIELLANKRNGCEKTLILSCGPWFFQQIRYFADEVGRTLTLEFSGT